MAVDALGWVRDMYAWSFAVARLKLVQDMPEPPNNPLMVQPPADKCVPGVRRSLLRVCSPTPAPFPQELGQGVHLALHVGAGGA